MPDQRPVYLPMRGTNRLSRRQAELILQIIPIDGADEFTGQDLKNYQRAYSKLARAWIAAITAESKREGGLRMPMKRKPRGVMPTHWRKTLKDYAPLGSPREWSVAMGIHYSTFIRTFRVRDYSFGSSIRRPEGSGFKLYEERVLEMRCLLGIHNDVVASPMSEADEPLNNEERQMLTQPKVRVRSDFIPHGSSLLELALSSEQVRKHCGSRQFRTIAFNTYKLDDGAMEAIHPLTWAR